MSQKVERGKQTRQARLVKGLTDHIMDVELYPRSGGTLWQEFSLETMVTHICLTAVITTMAALMGPVPTLYPALC